METIYTANFLQVFGWRLLLALVILVAGVAFVRQWLRDSSTQRYRGSLASAEHNVGQCVGQGDNGMEKVISHDGTSIAYYRSGSGAPLILIHGTSGSNPAIGWRDVLPTLEQHFSVYVSAVTESLTAISDSRTLTI